MTLVVYKARKQGLIRRENVIVLYLAHFYTVKKKGVTATHFGVFVWIFKNDTPWGVVVTA